MKTDVHSLSSPREEPSKPAPHIHASTGPYRIHLAIRNISLALVLQIFFLSQHDTRASTSDIFSFWTWHQLQWLKRVGRLFYLRPLDSEQDRCCLGGHQRRGHTQNSLMLWRFLSYTRCQGNWCKRKDGSTDDRKEFSRVLFWSGGGNVDPGRGTSSILMYLPSESRGYLKNRSEKEQGDPPSSVQWVEPLANQFWGVWQANAAGYFMFT